MNKGFALLIFVASMILAEAVLHDGGDLDRIAQAKGTTDSMVASEAEPAPANVAVMRSDQELASDRANGGWGNAGNWSPDQQANQIVEEELDAIPQFEPAEPTRHVQTSTMANRSSYTEEGALSREQLNVEE